MQSYSEVIEFPTHIKHKDNGPRFIAWRYDRGGLGVHVEGFDERIDGEMLLSFSPELGVEFAEPTDSDQPPRLSREQCAECSWPDVMHRV